MASISLKRPFPLVFRALAGLLLLALLLSWVGIESLKQAISGFNVLYYCLGLGMVLVHFGFQSVIIRILLASKQTVVRARRVFRLTIISTFFGLFLPGSVGPDIVLCYNMARSSQNKEAGLSAILFIRIAVLFLMALIGFVMSFHPLAARADIHMITGAVLLAFLAYGFIMANRNTLNIARVFLSFLNRHEKTAILYRTYFVLSDFGKDHRTLLRIAPLLLGSALIKIATDFVIAQALGFDIPLIYFLVFIPIITVISSIPLTFAGLGIREGSYIGFLALAGVPAEQALSVSLLSFTMVIVIAGAGALLYIVHGASLVTHSSTTNER